MTRNTRNRLITLFAGLSLILVIALVIAVYWVANDVKMCDPRLKDAASTRLSERYDVARLRIKNPITQADFDMLDSIQYEVNDIPDGCWKMAYQHWIDFYRGEAMRALEEQRLLKEAPL